MHILHVLDHSAPLHSGYTDALMARVVDLLQRPGHWDNMRRAASRYLEVQRNWRPPAGDERARRHASLAWLHRPHNQTG